MVSPTAVQWNELEVWGSIPGPVKFVIVSVARFRNFVNFNRD